MALLHGFPPPASFSFSSKSSLCARKVRFVRCCSGVKMSVRGEETGCDAGLKAGSAAVIWFKHDLRVDDHPGIVAAASRHRTVLPLYVFDHRILSRFSDEMLEILLFAMVDLRKSLKEQGSNLLIRFGNAESIIPELVKQVKATNIFAEEEVEYDLNRMIDIVKAALRTGPFGEGRPRIELWNTPFYDVENMKDLPASHHDFEKLKIPVVPPFLSPRIPTLEMEYDWGDVPTLDFLKNFINENSRKLNDEWSSIKKTSAEYILHKYRVGSLNKLVEGLERVKPGENKQSSLDKKYPEGKAMKNSTFLMQEGKSLGGGTTLVLNALAAYLRYSEGTIRDDWRMVHEKQRNAESREGASFGALFGPALCLGIISRRRVYYEAIKYEKERNGGFLSPFGYSTPTVASAVNTVCSTEWYWLLALKSQMNNKGPHHIRIWRWNGYLIQYTVSGCEGPAILLVHGFGAFLEHYRDNINGIGESGNRVWAITLLGSGKSEKPNLIYTEVLWAELLRDFIVDVIGEPVHLVGNSIGGYLVSIVAGLWPDLAKSVVLLNTAGDIVPGYSSVPFSKEREIPAVAWLGARLLLGYLRLRIKNVVKNCYPVKTHRADDWLINEMLRASYDPGAIVLLESIFSFNLSIPLNYLLKGFEGKVLVIQGKKDPLPNSKSKLALLREHCIGVVTRELNAGHCPHDEDPEEVNSIIQEWVVVVEKTGYFLLAQN